MTSWNMARRRKLIRKFLPGAVKTGVLKLVAQWDPDTGMLYVAAPGVPKTVKDRLVPLYRIVPEGEETEDEG